jgi:dCTP deaminase
MYQIDLSCGAVLEKGCIYIVLLLERLALCRGLSGVANPKSTTGRLDIFARLITDYGTEFNTVRECYQGPLYGEISSRTFSILVRPGDRLLQLRLRRGNQVIDSNWSQKEVFQTSTSSGLNSKSLSVDIEETTNRLIGWRARKHAGLIDIARTNYYNPNDYWEPVYARRISTNKRWCIVLDPGDFYILASKEEVAIPTGYAGEMQPFNNLIGEFRVHYAGFFDPGFGLPETGGTGSRAVLEVRAYQVPFLLEDSQVIGWLLYEQLTEIPDKLYSTSIGSSYQKQLLSLSKQFQQFPRQNS